MKILKFAFAVGLIAVFQLSLFGQVPLRGTVTEIIDGRTLVIEPKPGLKIAIQLDYLEVPEPEQPLHQLIKVHLTNLALDKDVEFITHGISDGNISYGQVFVGGIDLTQQMLRDGAAWYTKTGKNVAVSADEIYRENESRAKAEKRGVWSIDGMKPAWEFRAEKAERARQLKLAKLKELQAKRIAELEKAEAEREAQKKSRSLPGMNNIELWSNVYSTEEQPGSNGLISGTVPNMPVGYVMTGASFPDVKTEDDSHKLMSRSIYVFRNDGNPGKVLFIGFVSESKTWKFNDSSYLNVYADNRKMNLGKPQRFVQDTSHSVRELLLYRVTHSQLVKMAKAKKLNVRVGKYSGRLNKSYRKMMNDLAELSI